MAMASHPCVFGAKGSSVCVCVCVCVCERGREGGSVCVCVYVREGGREGVCVWFIILTTIDQGCR